eukprot:TRINITY_DN4386_c0_g1_i2.p1 TRINITY_DN4386_c0_g1~~TRINITY_DN4386_c0_g1_i2.p1  ORF type:complete len:171 (+),score=41.12 TRINITY_DN4386_c0_g1_i2:60-515(+)
MCIRDSSITVKRPQNTPKLNYNVACADYRIFATNFYEDRFRIAGFAEMRGQDYNVYEDRVELLRKFGRELVGDFEEGNDFVWTGLRPLSPDDGPMIGQIPNFKNVYINAGHGSKGMILSLGSARLLADHILNQKGSNLDIKNYSLDRFYLI